MNREQSEIKSKEQCHLDFLIELKQILEVTQYLSMSKLCEKHGVSSTAILAMQKGGIIKNSGAIGKGAIWSWNSKVYPNIQMAKELIDRSAKIKSDYHQMSKEKKGAASSPKKKVVTQQSPKKTISVLWGLFKIEQQ